MKPHTTATVLLVEPHEPTQLIVMLALEPEGFGVLPEGSMANAISAARMVKFDLCVCETRLPDGCGVDMADQLRQIQPEMRILFYSAFTTPEQRAAIQQHGYGLLPKPVCMADLKVTVIELLAA